MKQENKLNRKIKRLFRQAGHPRYWHRKGPKFFETWMLCLGLIVKQVYRLSYRRASKFLSEFYSIDMHWTTLQKAAKRLPKSIWQSLLAATLSSNEIYLSAGDGTTFTRSCPSQHYLKRIDREEPIGRPVQLVSIVDVEHRKFTGITIRASPKNEIRLLMQAYKQSKVSSEVMLLDKGFDAEYLHQWLNDNDTFAVIPVRKNARRGRFRKIMRDCFDYCLYWQRNIVESLFSALKRLFGTHLMCRKYSTQQAELFCRLIAYNIGRKNFIFY
jgi:transposase